MKQSQIIRYLAIFSIILVVICVLDIADAVAINWGRNLLLALIISGVYACIDIPLSIQKRKRDVEEAMYSKKMKTKAGKRAVAAAKAADQPKTKKNKKK